MNKQAKLNELRERMSADKSLPLRKGATHLVFGEGSPDADILCIGEGPGYWEDQKGIPFVGNAGALLNRLLLSIDIKRDDVFITNVVHFRPPENRDPLPDEIAAFSPYLDGIIEIIDPKVIITLGRFSMAKFLGSVTITSVHGKPKFVDWKGRKVWVIPMYHPAAGLRSGEIKTRLFEDFKKLPEVLEKINSESEQKNEIYDDQNKAEQMKLV